MKQQITNLLVRENRHLIAIIAIIGLSIFSCDNSTSAPCKNGHTFPGWTEPTCTVAGNSERVCKNCAQIDKRITGYDALGHQGLTPEFAATCTAAGSAESGTCTRTDCGHVIAEVVIPALGHQGLTPEFAATCTAAGSTESGACTRTGCVQVIAGTVIPALGHDHTASLICKRDGCDHQYALGATGPAGGIIFYISETGFTVQGYSGGSGTTAHLNFNGYTAYYLEAASSNVSTSSSWATNTGDLIPGLSQSSSDTTDWAIGRGRMNTAIIIARGIAHPSPYSTPAASACIALSIGGKSDWFLPSKEELNQLAQNRGRFGIPNSGLFSSSSQYISGSVWFQDFSNSSQSAGGKDYGANVRAVRAF